MRHVRRGRTSDTISLDAVNFGHARTADLVRHARTFALVPGRRHCGMPRCLQQDLLPLYPRKPRQGWMLGLTIVSPAKFQALHSRIASRAAVRPVQSHFVSVPTRNPFLAQSPQHV